MTENNRNMILAIVLSMLVLGIWQVVVVEPKRKALQEEYKAREAALLVEEQERVKQEAIRKEAQAKLEEAKALMEQVKARRIPLSNQLLEGSINTRGARFDMLSLKNYKESLDEDADRVHLFSPSDSDVAYFAQFGFLPVDYSTQMPDTKTVWKSKEDTFSENSPIELTWKNEDGVSFTQSIHMDENYMFNVHMTINNPTNKTIKALPYGLINKREREKQRFFILHEGPISATNGQLNEETYKDVRKAGKLSLPHEDTSAKGGWAGITDKYWLTAIFPESGTLFTSHFNYAKKNDVGRYQVDVTDKAIDVAPGESQTVRFNLYAGAKKYRLLEGYGNEYDLALFDRAIDFGWLYMLTIPLLEALLFLNGLVDHFGIAILMLTVCVRLLMFPLANASFRSMSKMRAANPELMELRERYKDDRVQLQQKMMEFYKERKINPVAGCLPLIIQIPVFFALYKVLFVTIEMRHADFFGWVNDLSAPDPTTIFNLFGVFAYDVPAFLPSVGIWPILMGITMFLQMQLNPPPADPIHATVMKFLPLIFVFVLAAFPAGLVIYWTWSNVLSILQQYVIMKQVEKEEARQGRGASSKA